MNTLLKISTIALMLFTGMVWSEDQVAYRVEQLPQLRQEAQHATVSSRVTARFTRSHYRQFAFNADFSRKIFVRYLNMLDYNHNVLLVSDIEQFKNVEDHLNNELTSGQLDTAFALFNLAQKRRFERYQYALSLLKTPMNFEGNDTIDIDRSKAHWPRNNAELNVLWYAKVKYDALNLKLTGKQWPEIEKILTKRYQLAIKRLTQSKSEDVIQLFMNAFAREIDPHTNYLSPRNAEQFNSEMSLSLEGIGAVLQQTEDDYTQINSLMAGGPAAKSKKLKVGDRIIAIGQPGNSMVDVIGWRLDDVVELIKGPKGSKVRLEILPAGKGSKTEIVTLTRERIRLEDRAVKMSVKTLGSEKVGVLDIPGFYVGLTEDVKVQLQKLEKQSVSNIIIDLRGNGGGALTEAVSLSGLFILNGAIVQIRDNNGKITEDAAADGIYYKGPLVVLVDRFSASASEIFAAAMQDYGRALIVGEPTFGKGTVQQYRSINRIYDQMLRPDWPDLGSVQYTIQKFYRVTGESTQLKGVTPDIVMPTGFDPAETGESFEDNALPWDSIKAASYHKVGDIQKINAQLIQDHQQWIAKDPEFQYVMQDIARYKQLKDKNNIISLNYRQREKENKDEDRQRLQRINERLKLRGKPQLKSLEDLPKDYKDPDPYLDETVKIALDLVRLEKESAK